MDKTVKVVLAIGTVVVASKMVGYLISKKLIKFSRDVFASLDEGLTKEISESFFVDIEEEVWCNESSFSIGHIIDDNISCHWDADQSVCYCEIHSNMWWRWWYRVSITTFMLMVFQLLIEIRWFIPPKKKHIKLIKSTPRQ